MNSKWSISRRIIIPLLDRLQVGIQSHELTPSKKNSKKSSSEPTALTIAYNRFHTNHFPYAYSWMAYGNGFVINLLYVFSSNTKENVNNLVIWAQQNSRLFKLSGHSHNKFKRHLQIIRFRKVLRNDGWQPCCLTSCWSHWHVAVAWSSTTLLSPYLQSML